jgi:hypothetical protein
MMSPYGGTKPSLTQRDLARTIGRGHFWACESSLGLRGGQSKMKAEKRITSHSGGTKPMLSQRDLDRTIGW